jgi:Ca2+-transporting ATPase
VTEPQVVPVHTSVPGRARFRVAGLRRNYRLKRALEWRLAGGGIHSISASTTTGTVLVLFDATREFEDIAQRLGDTARQLDDPGAGASGEAWHAMAADRVIAAVGGDPTGLSWAEAKRRLVEHGPNAIVRPPGRTDLEILLSQFHSLPIALLAAGALLSLATGGLLDAAVILGVICLNSAIGYWAEARAEATIGGLGEAREPVVKVLRDSETRGVPAEDLVPGDIIELRRDEPVPADARIIEANGLTVNEATLTGEGVPATKTAGFVAPRSAPIASQRNLVFRGTVVTGGAGRAVVVATGAHRELGRIQSLLGSERRPATPLERQLDELGHQVVLGAAAACGLFLVIGLIRGVRWLSLLKTVISLGVAAIPEGLPTLATTTLARTVFELGRRRIAVRRLGALEALAAVEVVCFDKTGTLTVNEMTVVDLSWSRRRARLVGKNFRAAGGSVVDCQTDRPLARLLELSILCNDAKLHDRLGRRIDGTPTEAALVRAAISAGVNVSTVRRRHPRLASVQRADDRRYMVTAHRAAHGQTLVVVKGDPGEVLKLCRWHLRDGRMVRLQAPERRAAIDENVRMASAALRVLGVGYRCTQQDSSAIRAPKDLVWAGLVGMADPIRPDAPGLIDAFRRAGVISVMLTGDQRTTAAAAAVEMRLSRGRREEIVHAQQLDDYVRQPHRTGRLPRVFSRVAPGQKLQLVRALQRSGRSVAMVGDGVNGTPPLRAADVGVALGRSGAEAARGIADVVLLEDDLAALAGAVERGRAVAVNIRKALRFLLSTNLSEIVVMLASALAGETQPLSPIQLLWINLLTDVLPALGLAMEDPAADLMTSRAPDANEPIISAAGAGKLARDAALMAASAFLARSFTKRVDGEEGRERTMGFATLEAAQLFYAFACRSRRASPLAGEPLPPNPFFLGTLGLSFAAHTAALLLPGFRRLFGPHLGIGGFAVSLAAGTAPLIAIDLLREIRSRNGAALEGVQ